MEVLEAACPMTKETRPRPYLQPEVLGESLSLSWRGVGLERCGGRMMVCRYLTRCFVKEMEGN